MAKKPTRLRFTEDDLADSKVKKAADRADKAADKAEKAVDKLASKKKATKLRQETDAAGSRKAKLRFGKADNSVAVDRPSSAKQLATRGTAVTLTSKVHRAVSEYEDDNVGIQSAQETTKAVESTAYTVDHAIYSHKLKAHDKADKLVQKSDKANVDALYEKFKKDNPDAGSNPFSRWRQKQAIKKEYAAAKAGNSTAKTTAAKGAEKAAQGAKTIAERVTEFCTTHSKVILLVLVAGLLFMVISSMFSSCAALFQGGTQVILGTSFTAEDEDIIGADNDYILKKLMARDDVVSLVCATDAGREGELIFRLVYHQCHCKKPFERLWISSMEDSAIMEGFENLKPGTEYDALYEAALCRERADWIVGINATRLFSTLCGQTLNVGRVMTPTLAMAVMREAAIAGFKPEPFYTVQIDLGGFTAVSERFKKKSDAEAVSRDCSAAVVTKAERKEKSEKPPALYDLTSLQRDANRVLGYTAQQTLDYTQNLYEKKLVTYPRTDSRYLTDDMAHNLPDLVNLAFHTFPVDGVDNVPVYAEQVVNNKKVTDHHAIIPTRELQKCNLNELPKGELAILQLISTRLFVAVGDPHRYAETVIELDCGGTAFSAKGKTILHDGWKALARKSDSTKSDEKEQALPSVSVGDEMAVISTEIKEGKTSPPKHYTEDTLLQSMETAGADEMPDEVERKGLGTPATRAGIIEKLVRIGFLERKGDKKTKHLIPTHKGTALVTVMPEQIQSPSMTADWEEKLLLIEKGKYASEDFMDEIKDVIAGLIRNYEVIQDSEVLMSKESNAVGKCPVCGSSVEEKAKAFFCSNRSCKFALWKNNRYFESIGKSMTSATAQKLLGSGKIKLKGCKSAKTGNTFDATVYMEVFEDGKTRFNMEFDNGGKRK